MDLLRLGLRNILGIALPGVIILLCMAYIIWGLAYFFNFTVISKWATSFLNNQWITFTLLFVSSYLFGSLLRLGSAKNLDEESGKYFQGKFYKDLEKEYKAEDTQTDLLQMILKTKSNGKKSIFDMIEEKILEGKLTIKDIDDKDKLKNQVLALVETGEYKIKIDPNTFNSKEFAELFDHWIWTKELFPYPIWELRKMHLYLHQDVFNFYIYKYKHCMGIGSPNRKYYGPGRGGSEFFNYCKIAIFNARKQDNDAMVEEVLYAEAVSRLYAGTFDALQITRIILLFIIPLYLVVYIILTQTSVIPNFTFNLYTLFLFVFVSIGVCVICELSRQHLIKNYRTLRLKEVDTIYDAFYLIASDCECGSGHSRKNTSD